MIATKHDGTSFNLLENKNPFILYFYPKNDTPVCTIQANDFTALKPQFEALGFDVFGVSKDNLKSHCKFIDKYNLTITLISDETLEICNYFGVWVQKSMMGKKYMGVERSTFVIKNGQIVKEWRDINAKGHANEVLIFCKTA